MNVRAITDAAALFGRPSQIGSADVRGWMRRVDKENDTWLYESVGMVREGAAVVYEKALT